MEVECINCLKGIYLKNRKQFSDYTEHLRSYFLEHAFSTSAVQYM